MTNNDRTALDFKPNGGGNRLRAARVCTATGGNQNTGGGG